MSYFEVFVAEAGYQKNTPLTYLHEGKLKPGAVVVVPFGRKQVSGFVVREVTKPDFEVKPILNTVSDNRIPKATLELHHWMMDYYPSGSGAVTQAFVPSGLGVKPRQTKPSRPKSASNRLPPLTADQKKILDEVNSSDRNTFLLHGETGSGKTRIYLEKAREAGLSGKSSLILVPEISLVKQVSRMFMDYFGEAAIILHSGLTKAARNKAWLKILNSTSPIVVIGTRSALFVPLNNIGFIAVDEMHEPAYKQDSMPRYYALRVAATLTRLHGAKIIYGSATPPVIEYFVAEQAGVPILRIAKTAKKSNPVKSTIVDLKNSSMFTRHRHLSDQLLDSISKRLVSGEQSLLFLNRRGSYRTILCQSCGWQALCPNCDIPLTYHGDRYQLRCHTCGYTTKPPTSCPQCSSDDIVYRSLGTKALVESLSSLFPEANIKRFDTDNLADEQLDRNFEDVVAGKVDILVGTQMLGKGLDLPKLSLVGIVNADTSLNVPDFSSTERSYQLLHQAIGRVGRGHLEGEVIIQSYNPENPTLVAASEQNWLSLYNSELKERSAFDFPPFYFLLKLTVSRRTASSAEENIYKLHSQVRAMPLKLKVSEPTPSFYEKSHGAHNWQLIIRAKDRGQLVEVIKRLPKGDYGYDLDPINLL